MVGDYVMVARVRRPDSMPKLVSTWTDSWRIVTVDKVHVYGVQNIVTGEVKHSVRRGQRPGDDGDFKGGVSTCFHTGRV